VYDKLSDVRSEFGNTVAELEANMLALCS